MLNVNFTGNWNAASDRPPVAVPLIMPDTVPPGTAGTLHTNGDITISMAEEPANPVLMGAAAIGSLAAIYYLGPSAIRGAQAYGSRMVNAIAGRFGGQAGRQTLFHYTNESGFNGILESGSLNASLRALNPRDVRYGNGQYLSDIVPGSMSPAQLSRQFLNNPFQGGKFQLYIEIDVSGLNAIQGRPGVFVIPGNVPLNINGLIRSAGRID